jgi:hypothetical protein
MCPDRLPVIDQQAPRDDVLDEIYRPGGGYILPASFMHPLSHENIERVFRLWKGGGSG